MARYFISLVMVLKLCMRRYSEVVSYNISNLIVTFDAANASTIVKHLIWQILREFDVEQVCYTGTPLWNRSENLRRCMTWVNSLALAVVESIVIIWNMMCNVYLYYVTVTLDCGSMASFTLLVTCWSAPQEVRNGLPSTLLLAIRTTRGAVRRTSSDPDYIQVAFLGPIYTATGRFLIRTKCDL